MAKKKAAPVKVKGKSVPVPTVGGGEGPPSKITKTKKA